MISFLSCKRLFIVVTLGLAPYGVHGAKVDVETGKITIETPAQPPKEVASKPPPTEPKTGVGVGPRRAANGNWEAGVGPFAPKATPPAAGSAPVSEQAAFYYAWSGLWIAEAWRPATLFVAGETKSLAIEKATYLFVDIVGQYAYGKAWAGPVVQVWAPRALWSGFTIYAYLIADPAEIGLGPEPFENGDRQGIRNYIDDLEKQKKTGMVPSTIRIPFKDLPEDYRGAHNFVLLR
jgi:hypothetical protein